MKRPRGIVFETLGVTQGKDSGEFQMRVDSSENWAFASRDMFKAMDCEHCVRLSMVVKAEVPSVVEKVKPFIEDLSKNLYIMQGNQRERIVFDQINASLPEGDFHEFDRPTEEQTIAAMNRSIPVIAQGYFARKLSGYTWSGYADLLVLDGYTIQQLPDGTIEAVQTGPVPESPKYSPWDVKNSSAGDKKYQVQLAAYLEALQELGLASTEQMGIVLGFNRGIVRYEQQESVELYREALGKLVGLLNQTTPNTITEAFINQWSCIKETACTKVYCDYPKLCKKIFKENMVLELLPNVHFTHSPKLREAGFGNVAALAACQVAPTVAQLDQKYADRYWKAARVMGLEFAGQKALISKITGTPALPEPTDHDVFFDVEWFNPVDSNAEFIFMFGVVGADEHFEVFIAPTPSQELAQFDKFLDYGMALLEANPKMHIYHYHNPEPKKVAMLVERYGGHRKGDADALIGRMVDLRPIVTDALVPGSGSYSIKNLEKYYDADSKLNRGGLVSGGGDAMYQFECFRVAYGAGQTDEANSIMQVIADYNKDDCLSTKLLYDWLRSLNFTQVDQIIAWD
jgi:predicted RecB family nuclease